MDAHLWLFFLLVLGVVLIPGLDMAYVLGSALVGGRRAGLAAVLGLVAGAMCHVTAGTLGIAVVLQTAPTAFNALLVAGALYVAWTGTGLWRAAASVRMDPHGVLRTPRDTFLRGAATNLMNPKAYVFMLAVFPQFVRAEYGPLPLQAAKLAAIIAATQIAVYGTVAWVASGFRAWFDGHPAAHRAVVRTVAGVLLAVAALSLLQGWRAS